MELWNVVGSRVFPVALQRAFTWLWGSIPSGRPPGDSTQRHTKAVMERYYLLSVLRPRQRNRHSICQRSTRVPA